MTYTVRKVSKDVGSYELLTDDTDGRGRVILVSLEEGRAWTYAWPVGNRSGSADIAGWVSDCGIEYVAGKMGADRWFDIAATTEAIWEYLSPLGITLDLHTLEGLASISSEAEWATWLATDALSLYSAYECARYDVDPEFRRAFCAVWPSKGGRFPKAAP